MKRLEFKTDFRDNYLIIISMLGEFEMKDKEQLRLLWKERRVNEIKTSGLTMKKWCDDQGLKVHQLQYWIKKYSTTSSNTLNNWVEIELYHLKRN